MDIFEKQVTNKIYLDDTDKLSCVIENAHNINKHTEYCIRVQRGPSKDNSWCISRRYNDFTSLNSSLQIANVALPLPPKKIMGNMQPGFIAERQVALQAYLDAILKNMALASSLVVKIFLDPDNYSVILNELALQNLSMALRGDGVFELKSPMPNIGWRIRKHYFMVCRNQSSADNNLLSWQTYGPDKVLQERDMQCVFKSLMSLEHPYIDKIVFLHSLEKGAYTIRSLHACGSVRDHLYGTQYGSPYLSKYANPKQRKPFTIGQVAHYGYQILQALKYLHDRGLPYGHLHVGNLAIEKQKVLLMDVENCVIGVPVYYRQFILDHKKICTMESVDVYCFGHTLYEMAFGEPLEQSTCDEFPSNSSIELVSVLRMILTSGVCKHGLPDIDTLLTHPFFSNALSVVNGGQNNRVVPQCHLKFPLHIKEELKKVASCIETRLRNDQKLARSERRQLRIQEILSSEEEMRKRKRKVKNKDTTLTRSHSSLNGAGTVQNGLSPSSMSAPSERSGSVASTLSTASSPTPPQLYDDTSCPNSVMPTPATPCRGAFLQSICAFDKSNLNKTKK